MSTLKKTNEIEDSIEICITFFYMNQSEDSKIKIRNFSKREILILKYSYSQVPILIIKIRVNPMNWAYDKNK